ncbi:glycosyltransferase [Lutibacter sp. B1]|uniref:glycosyltransferase n=1 Tax=Lutibacter sp. B1 TaxID=2725996 RepID=UPI0014572CAB|nr:glycosyltransferase [Lutibacter sp. B1]NLP59056.1 glycosyltransferase family 4 protein [Lutibacter sp. B1]
MKNILIIGFVWPEPDSTAAGNRMLQLIELFLENNYNISFASTASKTDKSYNFDKLKIQTFDIELNNSNFDLFVKKLNPDIVLFDRYLTEEQFGWRVAENCPNALRILDTEDLHFLRYARQEAFKKDKELSLEFLINDITKREIASIYRCDLSLIISTFEMKLLVDTFKMNESILCYILFLLDYVDLNTIHNFPTFNEREHFITIGNFKHKPNWSSVIYLKEVIWPLIRNKLPNVDLHIYGAYASEEILQLHKKNEGFIIKGWAKNVEQVFKKAKVCLAPLQFGAGLKGKLIDAMLYGTPSITTSIGAEAMHCELLWNGFIEDDPENFALKAVELYTNKKKWEESQTNGVKIINHCYSKNTYGVTFLNKLETTKSNLEKHRLNNFTGLMLTHHTLKSTKYMSKWIEEKNKN